MVEHRFTVLNGTLSCNYLQHGGTYAFVYEAFGEALAFSITWLGLFLNNPAAVGVYGRTTATYVLALAFPECQVPAFINNIFSMFLIGEFIFFKFYLKFFIVKDLGKSNM